MNNENRIFSGDDWSHAIAKLLISMVAAGGAAFVPRLVAIMAVSNDANDIELFSIRYLIIASIFVVFIGISATIIMWRSELDPQKIFMTALSVPAIVSGSFGTAQGINDVKIQRDKNESLVQALQTIEGIATPKDLDWSSLTSSRSIQRHIGSMLSFSLISPVHAQESEEQESEEQENGSSEPTPTSTRSWLGTVVREPQYQNGLGGFESLEQAQAAAESFNISFEIVSSQNREVYYLIDPDEKSLAEATLESLKLKEVIEEIIEDPEWSAIAFLPIHPVVVPSPENI